MIGINSLSLNDDFEAFLRFQNYFDGFECSKKFYYENLYNFDKIRIPCTCVSSLVRGNYDLKTERQKFLMEFIDSCKIANDLDCNKLMFGLLRYRKNVDADTIKFFTELVDVAKSFGCDLLYEALSEKTGNQFLKTHNELIDFSKENNISSIHVDYKTLELNKEKINLLDYPISNFHYPIGIPICVDYASLENYNNWNISEIEQWIKSLL